jgi:threonine dehydratase
MAEIAAAAAWAAVERLRRIEAGGGCLRTAALKELTAHRRAGSRRFVATVVMGAGARTARRASVRTGATGPFRMPA